MSDDNPWRVGRKLGRTVYCGEQFMALFDDPDMAQLVVNKMNDDWHGCLYGPIASSRVVSEPGACVEVTEYTLTPEARAGLNIGSASLSGPAQMPGQDLKGGTNMRATGEKPESGITPDGRSDNEEKAGHLTADGGLAGPEQQKPALLSSCADRTCPAAADLKWRLDAMILKAEIERGPVLSRGPYLSALDDVRACLFTSAAKVKP